jgi:hypothetical protein
VTFTHAHKGAFKLRSFLNSKTVSAHSYRSTHCTLRKQKTYTLETLLNIISSENVETFTTTVETYQSHFVCNKYRSIFKIIAMRERQSYLQSPVFLCAVQLKLQLRQAKPHSRREHRCMHDIRGLEYFHDRNFFLTR